MENLYKNWLVLSKIIWGILITSGKQWKVQKVEINELHFSQKYIPSVEALYTEDFPNITFNYLYENSPNSLCYFWNHKLFFRTQLVCIILAQILHTFDKNIPWKCKFLDFPLLKLKFKSFFKQKVSFSLNFASLFCVMRDISSVLF